MLDRAASATASHVDSRMNRRRLQHDTGCDRYGCERTATIAVNEAPRRRQATARGFGCKASGKEVSATFSMRANEVAVQVAVPPPRGPGWLVLEAPKVSARTPLCPCVRSGASTSRRARRHAPARTRGKRWKRCQVEKVSRWKRSRAEKVPEHPFSRRGYLKARTPVRLYPRSLAPAARPRRYERRG
jgi:hypothetical protein